KQIFLFTYHRVGDKQNAADITSEVFLKALEKIEGFVYKGLPLSAWLYRIAINECNEYFRKSRQQKLIVLNQATIERLVEEMGEKTSEGTNFQVLANAMRRLDDQSVQIIQLRYFEAMPFKEIGQVLDITENNAKVRLYRAIAKLRLKMGLK
ncbi:RNA polymerase sigma factor, partial [Fulvivirga kasyanovii]